MLFLVQFHKIDLFNRSIRAADLEGGIGMAEVRVRKNESLDSALRRFKRDLAKSGILSEIKKRKHYEKPSVRRKKKSEAARRRSKH